MDGINILKETISGKSNEKLRKAMALAIEKNASDLHLCAGHKPIVRINGDLIVLPEEEEFSESDMASIVNILLPESRRQRFLQERDIDFSYSLEDKIRFRGNIYFQMNKISCSLRLIPNVIKTLDDLALPKVIHSFAQPKQGFVVVTGPSNQGKSTTLAAIIDEITKTRNDHIITIEDPIEYIFSDNQSIIDQREVDKDVATFDKGLRASLRQDPDVIMVGEIRDLETMTTALTAAETGHLVFATLHTNSAAETIHRIIDSFPGDRQNQIRAQLSTALFGIISQRLVPSINGTLVPVCEVLFNNTAVSNLIRDNKIHEVPSIIETSASQGMVSMNKSLAYLVKQGIVSLDVALNYSLNPTELKSYLNQKYEI